MQDVLEYLDRNKDRSIAELTEFLRIPSVSAAAARKGDVRRAGEFCAEHLRRAGFQVEVIPTDGHPLVVAERIESPHAPTVLIYGHFDVQPPDPLDLWITGPFEPTIRGENIYARGATDDKGQLFTHIKAVEAWMSVRKSLPLNVRFLLEGEEEVGSESIGKYLREHADRFPCDYAVISDTSQLGPDQPAITYGLRGIAYFEILLDGPNRDLHSGVFGGSVQNPANALCELIASLKDGKGRIQIPGFYDDVLELSPIEKEAARKLPFDEAGYQRDLGVKTLFGEEGYSTLERKWVRPTCDVNGLFGGYQGEGSKTVLPAKAGAKISFRLVPRQDPAKIERAFQKHLQAHLPPGVTMKIIGHNLAEAVVVPLESAGVRAAARAIAQGFGKEPYYIREGGSIPIVSDFKKLLGVDTLLLGFGLPDDNPHSPNEKFSLRDFHRGTQTSACLLAELAKIKA